MVFRFTAQRHMRLAVTLLALCCVAGARAEDAPAPSPQQQPAATPSPSPSGQKGGAGRGNGATPPAAEAHRLPPDSTTKQTLALPGRTLDFTATAGSIRLFDDKGEPQADIAYTSYQLDGTRSRKPSGDVSVQWRSGRVLGLAAVRRRRAMAIVDRGRWRGVISDAGGIAQCRDLARLHRSRFHRSRRHRLQPIRRVRRGRAQAVLFRRRRRQFDCAGDPALAGKIRPLAVAEIRDRRELWRHSRTENRSQSADPAGRRRARADPGFSLARLPRLFRLEPAAIHVQPAEHGGGGARGEGAGDARRSRRGRTLRADRVSHRSHQGAGRQGGDDAARRQGGGADRHRSGCQPQACRAF